MRFKLIQPQIVISIATIASLAIFTWPLFIESTFASDAQVAQTVFIFLMPALILFVLAQYSAGGIETRQLAILGVLTALNSVIRLLGAGVAGIETVFFLIIIGAFVFRSSFGFALGALSLLVSAVLSGGIGPWLPFQMMAAALVGVGAGLLPRFHNRVLQILCLAAYAVFASFAYGALMTLWNWPYLAGIGTTLSYLPGAGLIDNLERFWQYQILTGGLAWDAGRAITTVILIGLTAPALIATLERAATRAGFRKY